MGRVIMAPVSFRRVGQSVDLPADGGDEGRRAGVPRTSAATAQRPTTRVDMSSAAASPSLRLRLALWCGHAVCALMCSADYEIP